MIFAKCFLLLLVVCGLCHTSLGVCTSTGLWGRRSVNNHRSENSVLAAGIREFRLQIPNGHYVCYKTPQKYFVGEEVIVCDDFPATVQFVMNDPTIVSVVRNGLVLAQDAISFTKYHCDYVA